MNVSDQAAELHRVATARKTAGDWDGAIASLRAADNLLGKDAASSTPQTWCRLPIFLQQAGRFDESMAEFDRLLSLIPERVDHLVQEGQGRVLERRLHFTHSWRSQVLECQVKTMRREFKRIGHWPK